MKASGIKAILLLFVITSKREFGGPIIATVTANDQIGAVSDNFEIMINGDLDDFGLQLNKAWQEKRSLSKLVSNSQVDGIYNSALSAGALGGKLSGAGGGGVLLLYVPVEKQTDVKQALSHLLHVPFSFEAKGSQIIFYDRHRKYIEEEMAHAENFRSPFVELEDIK